MVVMVFCRFWIAISARNAQGGIPSVANGQSWVILSDSITPLQWLPLSHGLEEMAQVLLPKVQSNFSEPVAHNAS